MDHIGSPLAFSRFGVGKMGRTAGMPGLLGVYLVWPVDEGVKSEFPACVLKLAANSWERCAAPGRQAARANSILSPRGFRLGSRNFHPNPACQPTLQRKHPFNLGQEKSTSQLVQSDSEPPDSQSIVEWPAEFIKTEGRACERLGR